MSCQSEESPFLQLGQGCQRFRLSCAILLCYDVTGFGTWGDHKRTGNVLGDFSCTCPTEPLFHRLPGGRKGIHERLKPALLIFRKTNFPAISSTFKYAPFAFFRPGTVVVDSKSKRLVTIVVGRFRPRLSDVSSTTFTNPLLGASEGVDQRQIVNSSYLYS